MRSKHLHRLSKLALVLGGIARVLFLHERHEIIASPAPVCLAAEYERRIMRHLNDTDEGSITR